MLPATPVPPTRALVTYMSAQEQRSRLLERMAMNGFILDRRFRSGPPISDAPNRWLRLPDASAVPWFAEILTSAPGLRFNLELLLRWPLRHVVRECGR